MKRIVIPTDFSKNAQHALDQAMLFFEKDYCEFYLIHAYSDKVIEKNAEQSRRIFNDIKAEAKAVVNDKLIDLLEYAQEKSNNPLHHFKIRGIYHSLLDAIDDLVNQEECDLIVMGTKGESNIPNSTFGSTTLTVAKYVECPVLAIPKTGEFKPPKNILFPTNFMLYNSSRELKLLNQLGKSFSSKIHFLNYNTRPNLSRFKYGVKTFIEEHLKDCDHAVHIVDGENIISAINTFVEQNDIDLISIANTQESYLESMLQKTTLDNLTLFSKVPLLILQNIER